jgi:hypothetical protein
MIYPSSFLVEDATMTFSHGLLFATLLGLFGTFELWSLTGIFAAIKRMSSPPHPALKPKLIPDEGYHSDIGTDPIKSPANIVVGGCLTIIGHLILQVVVLGGSIYFLSSPQVSVQRLFPDPATGQCVVGAATAGVLGIVLRTLVWNWDAIGNLWGKMMNPPKPALPKANPVIAVAGAATATPSGGTAAVAAVAISPEPPNVHYVGATPPMSPIDVLGQGCLEIVARLILQVLLFGVLGFWAWLVYSYMSNPYQ